MEIDQTTFEDLSVFHHEEGNSIFDKLNFTRTLGGKFWMMQYFSKPFSDENKILATQKILSLIIQHADKWPLNISNGTIMVMERFYETAIDEIPEGNLVNGLFYKLFHTADFSLLRYSLSHFADFARGMQTIGQLFRDQDCAAPLANLLSRAAFLLNDDKITALAKTTPGKPLNFSETVYYGNHVRYRFKVAAQELIEIYGKLDAWYSMAMATRHFQFSFPSITQQHEPYINAEGLYHILLPAPIAYNVELDRQKSFIFLTGANMGGKSTFIRAVGASVFLAHLGMGVPAKSLTLSIFDGILSNINVEDNLAKGESYFFNEVQRVKNTILKINDKRRWLVLIDELFKGTNVQDAMKCSEAVVKGLIKIKNSLFILSTHLYEIGEALKPYPNISFKYFETSVEEDQLHFSYQLKDGISNDRLGYLILKREKVVELLENL